MKSINPKVIEIDYKYVQFFEPFVIYIKLLKRAIAIPTGFVCDRESVPIIRATSIRGGYVHGYLCRVDSDPVVTKKVAADAYLEVMERRDMEYRDRMPTKTWLQKLNKLRFRADRWHRRHIKCRVVRMAWGYFHKLHVMASYEEVAGL